MEIRDERRKVRGRRETSAVNQFGEELLILDFSYKGINALISYIEYFWKEDRTVP